MSLLSKPRSKRKLRGRSNGMLMTPEEFDAVADVDDRYIYELIRGVVIVSPAPGVGDRDANDELNYLLRQYLEDDSRGSVLDATLPEQYVYLSDSRRRADRVVWVGLGRLPVIGQDVPSIVIEFVSKQARDRVRDYEVKRDEYLNLGVQEYWVIDRFSKTMTVFRQPLSEPAEVVVSETQTYQTPLLPGFELPLNRILERANRWELNQSGPRKPRTQS